MGLEENVGRYSSIPIQYLNQKKYRNVLASTPPFGKIVR